MIEVTADEMTFLMNWKKQPDTFILPRMKSEAILYVFEDADITIVAKLIDRSVKIVKGWIADTAYIGTGAITPIEKTPGSDRLDWEKKFNHDVSGFRSRIEYIVGHLKNWKILTKGYRGRLAEFPTIIRIVTRPELCRIGW
ncbi:hypothetical protein [Acidipropionibacterium jensenii]|uniref:hypothetical protein n=1 Tax=Acidipropionibacterium jensenii TaxID=1749 RepID=UPI001FD22B10|nr:hypothetical protein [Acidipropionibacterium jensenii]